MTKTFQSPPPPLRCRRRFGLLRQRETFQVILMAWFLGGAAPDVASAKAAGPPVDVTASVPGNVGPSGLRGNDYFAWRRTALQRIVDIGYLVVRSAGACPANVGSLGFVIEQRDQFSPGDRSQAGFSVTDSRPRVAAVAVGSPAEQAGLRKGDVLALWPAAERTPADKPTFIGIEKAVDEIEARVQAAMERPYQVGMILPVVRGDVANSLMIPLAAGCGAWFDLRQAGPADAGSDSRWIQVTEAILALLADDDDGLAFVIGHELAHRVMRLAPHGAHMLCGQRCEEQADRLGVEFAARAGFSVERAPAVLTLLGSARPGFLGGRRQALLERAALLRTSFAVGASLAPVLREPAAPTRRSLQNAVGTAKNP